MNKFVFSGEQHEIEGNANMISYSASVESGALYVPKTNQQTQKCVFVVLNAYKCLSPTDQIYIQPRN